MFLTRTNPLNCSRIGSAVCLLIALSALTGVGQSGRRGSKSPPVSVATPEPTTPEKKPVAPDQPKVPVILTADRNAGFGSIPSYYYDGVIESCARRLDESNGVRLEVGSGEMTRGDAVKRAKGEKEGFVVWLNLRADGFSRSSNTNPDEIFIEFTVFEPTTAKIRTQGNSYQGVYRQGGVTIPGTSGRNSSMITDARLREAARDAAEKILKALHLASVSDIPPH